MSPVSTTSRPSGMTALINARLLDPCSKLDEPGGLLVQNRKIEDYGSRLFSNGVPEGSNVVDCNGHCLCPGFVDMRAHLREPGAEHKKL